MPPSLSYGDAGALPLVGLTSLQALREAWPHQPQPKQRRSGPPPPPPPPPSVFITSGAGGTGHVAIQIAKAWGANVTAVGGTADAYFMLKLGANSVVDYQIQSNVFAGIPDNSLDVVYDNFGAPGTADHAMAALKPGGTFIFLPGNGGAISPAPKKGVRQIDFGDVDPGNYTDLDALSALVENGKLFPHVQATFSIDGEIPAAFNLSMKGAVQGKIGVLIPAVPLPRPPPPPGPPGPVCNQYNCPQNPNGCDAEMKACNALKDCWFEPGGIMSLCIFCWGQCFSFLFFLSTRGTLMRCFAPPQYPWTEHPS